MSDPNSTPSTPPVVQSTAPTQPVAPTPSPPPKSLSWYGQSPPIKVDMTSSSFACGGLSSYNMSVEGCFHEGLEVEHKADRKIKLPVPVPQIEIRTLEVVAGYDQSPQDIKCKTQPGSLCSGHDGRNLDAIDTPPQTLDGVEAFKIDKQTSSELEFKVRSIRPEALKIWRSLWPSLDKARFYTVRASSCHGITLEAEVAAYPDIVWGGEITIAFGTATSTSTSEQDNVFTETEDNSFSISIDGKISAEWDGGKQKYELSSENSKKWKAAFKLVNDGLAIASWLKKEVAKGTSFDLNFGIEIKFGGSWQLADVPASHKVDRKYEINGSLYFKPSGSVDFTDLILTAVPYAGPLLKKAKDRAEDGIGWEAAQFTASTKIELGFNGQFGGEGTFSHFPGTDVYQGSGALTGKVEVFLKGALSGAVKFKVWRIETGASAGVGAEGTAGVEGRVEMGADHIGPYGIGVVRFTGLVVKVMAHFNKDFEFGGKRETEGVILDTESENKGAAQHGSSWDKEWTLINPADLLGSSNKEYLIDPP